MEELKGCILPSRTVDEVRICQPSSPHQHVAAMRFEKNLGKLFLRHIEPETCRNPRNATLVLIAADDDSVPFTETVSIADCVASESKTALGDIAYRPEEVWMSHTAERQLAATREYPWAPLSSSASVVVSLGVLKHGADSHRILTWKVCLVS